MLGIAVVEGIGDHGEYMAGGRLVCLRETGVHHKKDIRSYYFDYN